jgi:hypothetical protein
VGAAWEDESARLSGEQRRMMKRFSLIPVSV